MPYYADQTVFTVEVATDADVQNCTVLETINLGSCTAQQWYEKTIDLSAYANQNVYIVFRVNNGYFGAGVLLDDIEIGSCLAPKGVAVTDVTAHGASISWNESTGVTEYYLSYKKINESDWSNEITLTTANYTFPYLDAATQYDVRISAKCSEGDVSAFANTSFTTEIACHAPTNITETNITAHTATISWEASNDATSYKLYYKIYVYGDEEGPWMEELVTGTTCTLTGLTSGTRYSVKVVSDCGEEGFSSATESFFDTDIACHKPADVKVSALNDNSMTLVWNSSTEASSWKVSYKENSKNAEWSEDVVVFDTTYTFENLDPKTSYTARVISNCGTEGLSVEEIVEFRTTAVPIALPYNQTFDNGEDLDDFMVLNDEGTDIWSIGSATATEVEGKSMYISKDNGVTNSYSNTTVNSFAVLTVNFENQEEYHLSFDYKVKGDIDYWGGIDDYLSVYIAPVTEPIPTWAYTQMPSTFKPLLYKEVNVSEWTNIDFILDGDVKNTTQNIIFLWHNDVTEQVGTNPAAIDNIRVYGSDCVTPTNVSVSEITETTAKISWQQTGEMSSWNVKYRMMGAIEWQSASANETSVVLNDLIAGTVYTVKVEGLCFDGTVLTSASITFVTVCSSIDLSTLETNTWKQSFEESSDLQLTDMCFTFVEYAEEYGQKYPRIFEGDDAHTGILDGTSGSGHFVKFNKDNMLALPKFTGNIEDLRLKFWYRHDAGQQANIGTVQIGVVTDINDANTFLPVKTLTPGVAEWGVSTYYPEVVDFSATALTGSDYYIAIKYTSANSYTYWYFDDLEVGYVPDCSGIDMSSVEVENVAAKSATISFTDANTSHNAWTIYYKAEEAQEYSSVQTTTPSSALITELTPETTYQVYVVTDCGGVESEDKSIPVSFKTLIACLEPKNLVVSDVTDNSAKVSWTAAEGTSFWKVSYKASADEEWLEYVDVTDATYEFTQLDAATAYDVKVVTDCGDEDGISKEVKAKFVTTAIPVETPYYQDFENDNAFNDFQILTYSDKTDGVNAWVVGSATTTEGGDKSMYVSKDDGATHSYDNGNETNAWAVLTVNFGEESEYHLSFDYKVPGGDVSGNYAYDYLSVFVVPTTESIPDDYQSVYIPASWTKVLDKKCEVADWTHEDIILNGVSGAIKNIIFQWRNDYSGGNQIPAAIDNISITGSACATPSNVSVSEITSTTAQVTWENTGSATAWNVKYKTDNETEWSEKSANTTSVELTELESATQYSVKVEALCGDETKASEAIKFTTECSVTKVTDDISWQETFADEDNLYCWEYKSWYVYNGGMKCLYYGGDELISPVFDLTEVTTPYITFKHNEYGSYSSWQGTTLYDTLKVLYRVSVGDEWVELASYASENEGALQTVTLALPNKSATYQICFSHISNDANGVVIDDVEIFNNENGEQPQPCDVPTNLTVTTKTQTTATITWEGSAASYELQLDGNASQDVTATTYIFNDLAAGTTYTVKVRAVCSEETTSDWATITFTTEEEETPEPCDAPTNVTVSELIPTTAVISWEGTAETYEVTVGDKAPVNVQTNSYTCSGLTANTTYTVKVRSICGEDNFSEFVTTTFKTLEDESGLTDVENGLSVKVHPNPTTDNATLEIKGINGSAKLIVTDVNGRVIDDVNVSDGVETIIINSERYASGVYYVRVMGEGINETTTLIKK